MDPLSFSASIIAIVGISAKIISACKDYISTVKDAPDDLRTIFVNVASLKTTLETIDFLVNNAANKAVIQSLQELAEPTGPINGCSQTLTSLHELIPCINTSATNGKKQKHDILARLAWPLKEKKARKLLTDVEQYKSTLSLALTVDLVKKVHTIDNKVSKLCESTDARIRDEVINWLVTTDPSPLHNVALNLRNESTGAWLEKVPVYRSWKAGLLRTLWFHGIPGAGKTVLMSHIIEDLRSCLLRSTSNVQPSVYYYCHHSHAQDETGPFLRWAVSQLSRNHNEIPQILIDAHRTGTQPSVRMLFDAFSVLSRQFDRVYLLIDALDESASRLHLLKLLIALSGPEHPNVHICATSRVEYDIACSFGKVAHGISLSNEWVDADIRSFVHNQLRQHHRLARWPESLRVDIEAALVKGAQGMFRWAACHIDILGRLHDQNTIEQSLKKLPRTLFETYERVIQGVDEENHLILRRALLVLAFPERWDPLSDLGNPNILDQIVLVDVENLQVDPESQLSSEDALEDMCGCLVTSSSLERSGKGARRLRLAHYTVKEFLTSDDTANGPVEFFHMSCSQSDLFGFETSALLLLEGLRQQSQSKDPVYPRFWSTKTMFPQFRWYWYISKIRQDKLGETDSIIDTLFLRLFDGQVGHDAYYLHVQKLGRAEVKFKDIPIWRTSSGEITPHITVLYAWYFGLYRVADTVLAANKDLYRSAEIIRNSKYTPGTGQVGPGTLLEIAVTGGFDIAVRRFLDGGADPNMSSTGRYSPLYAALAWGPTVPHGRGENRSLKSMHSITTILLEYGAEPNGAYAPMTPLQLAVQHVNPELVELLLGAGADPNAVGNDQAVIDQIRAHSSLDYHVLQRATTHTTNYSTPLKLAEDWRRTNAYFLRPDLSPEILACKNRIVTLLANWGGQAMTKYPNLDDFRKQRTLQSHACLDA